MADGGFYLINYNNFSFAFQDYPLGLNRLIIA